jgi:hypothetical protein
MSPLLSYEQKHEPVASLRQFSIRLGRNVLWALGLIVAALAAGMAGYFWFEDMGPADAFVNAAMILSGMGPLQPLATTGGKIFAGLYAIASGLLIFGIAGLVLAPVFHRLLHRFHVSEEDENIGH